MAKTAPPRPPAAPPATVAEDAAHVRGFVVKLHDRQNGEGVNKRVIAETLFRAAFDMLDELPDDVRQAVARRVHEGSYHRLTDHSAPSKKDVSEADSGVANIAGFKSSEPGPGKRH